MLRRFTLLPLLFVATACATAGVKTVTSAPPRPKDCALQVFTSEKAVKTKYEVLCHIESKTGTSLLAEKTVAGALKVAKPHACKCGADALILTGSQTDGVSLVSWGRGHASVKAIRFKRSEKK